jgi:ketosteroid isomerase-like protein
MRAGNDPGLVQEKERGMKKICLLVAVAALLVALPSAVRAGEWSAEQKEVWEFIKTCNDHFANKDVEAAMDCIHDDFSGWLYSQPVPRGKASFEGVGTYMMKTRDTVASELRPIDILVYGNFAIAHYFYVEVQKDQEGKESFEQGRWTDVMIKEDGKWRWIADHGGSRGE